MDIVAEDLVKTFPAEKDFIILTKKDYKRIKAQVPKTAREDLSDILIVPLVLEFSY